MNALYYDNDMHEEKDDIFFLSKCVLVFKCLSLSVKSRWWATFVTDQGDVLSSPCVNQEAISNLSITTSPWLMTTTNFIDI